MSTSSLSSTPSRTPERIDAMPRAWVTALAVGALAVLYLWVFPYHPGINNPNENVRVYMTVAAVDDQTFAINRIERDWGYTNDKSVRDGKLYSSKAPGTSYLGIPAYWALTKLTHRNSIPLTPAQVAAHHRPPLDRALVYWVLRTFTNAFPALVFAVFFHRFLGARTRSPALRDAVFFSVMAGSLVFAYSEIFASHAQNAICAAGALMALASVRDDDRTRPLPSRRLLAGRMFTAGLLGAGATMFEYPAAIASLAVAALVVAVVVERRAWLLLVSAAMLGVSAKLALTHHRAPALLAGVLALGAFAATLTPRSFVRLATAGLGGAIPVALTLYYHWRCFGDPFKPGYSYLENPTFRAETSQGFFGATAFSWEAAVRLWFDPSFGLVPGTALLVFALLGTGATLAPDYIPTRWRAPLRVLAALVLAGTLGMVFKTTAVLADRGWDGANSAPMYWIALAPFTVMFLASVTLPKPVRADAAIALAVLFSSAGLSRLIGAMNNWRGGWVVGPRYLATLVPMLGIAALWGLDSLASVSPAWRRAATVAAAGATASALAVSGLPSAYFPHVPTDYISPLFELFVPLVQHGFVPHNVAEHFWHASGNTALAPFFVVAALVVLRLAIGDERRLIPRVAHAAAAMAVTCLVLAPLARASHPETRGSEEWVESVWEPRPAPEPVRIERPIAPGTSPEQLRELARAYAEKGDTRRAWEAAVAAARTGH